MSDRFLNDCHEYIFHFTKYGDVHLDSWLSGYHTKIRQTLSAGRQPTRKTDGTEATFGSYLIKRYKAEAASVRTLQHFLSASRYVHQVACSAKLVIDPFVGIGSTAVVAMHLGISFVGFEIDKEYLDAAIDRIPHV